MDDFTKVLLGLNAHAQGCGKRTELCDEFNCPYRDEENNCDIEQMCIDAVSLIKEQHNQISMMKMIYGDQGEIIGKLVRCRDCKYGGCRTTYTDGRLAKVVCKKHGTKKNEIWMDADWYCADGRDKNDV